MLISAVDTLVHSTNLSSYPQCAEVGRVDPSWSKSSRKKSTDVQDHEQEKQRQSLLYFLSFFLGAFRYLSLFVPLKDTFLSYCCYYTYYSYLLLLKELVLFIPDSTSITLVIPFTTCSFFPFYIVFPPSPPPLPFPDGLHGTGEP